MLSNTVHALQAAPSPSLAPLASSSLCIPTQCAEPHSSAKRTAHASHSPGSVTSSLTVSTGVTRSSARKVGQGGAGYPGGDQRTAQQGSPTLLQASLAKLSASCPNTYRPICTYAYMSNCPPIQLLVSPTALSIRRFVYLLFHPSVSPSTCLSPNLLNCQSTHLSVYPTTCLCVYCSILHDACIHSLVSLTACLSVGPYIHSFIHPSSRLSVSLWDHQSTHLLVCSVSCPLFEPSIHRTGQPALVD